MRRLALLGLTALSLWRCAGPKEKIPPPPETTPTGEKIVIYQMMTRLFGNTMTTNKPYGTMGENGSGKFDDINNKALDGIKELGVTHIWYAGVIEHATVTDYSAYDIRPDDPDVVKGRAGSPYAIKDYYDVDPDLAVDVPNRMMEFEQLVARTHKHGLKVIIDFVPNHVARAYYSDVKPEGIVDLGESDDKTKAFASNNNFYYLPGQPFQVPREHFALRGVSIPGMDGKFDELPAKATGDDAFTATPPVDSWFETVKLNYGVDYLKGKTTHFDSIPDTWMKMRDILLFWAGKKIDGIRCDAAHMVPIEFWNWVIPQIKAVNHELIFISEIDNPSVYRDFLTKGRFDFLFDKVQLYDTLRLLINGKASSLDIPGIQQSLSGINNNMVHFLESHAAQRIASGSLTGDPSKSLSAFVVSAMVDGGPIMIYFGQEVGEPAGGVPGFEEDNGHTTQFDYWGVTEHQKWVNNKLYDGGQLSDAQKELRKAYQRILTLARDNPAIATGKYNDLTASNVTAKRCSDRVVSFTRDNGEEKLIVIAGFNAMPERIQIMLTPEVLKDWKMSESQTFDVVDLLGSTIPVSMDTTTGLNIDLPPFGVLVLSVKGIGKS